MVPVRRIWVCLTYALSSHPDYEIVTSGTRMLEEYTPLLIMKLSVNFGTRMQEEYIPLFESMLEAAMYESNRKRIHDMVSGIAVQHFRINEH